MCTLGRFAHVIKTHETISFKSSHGHGRRLETMTKGNPQHFFKVLVTAHSVKQTWIGT